MKLITISKETPITKYSSSRSLLKIITNVVTGVKQLGCILFFFVCAIGWSQPTDTNPISLGTTIQANFGVDADVEADVLRFQLTPGTPDPFGTDDWFDFDFDFSHPGTNVINVGVGEDDNGVSYATLRAQLLAGDNIEAEFRMSRDIYSLDLITEILWIDAVYFRDQRSNRNNTDGTVFDQAINKNFNNPLTWTLKDGGVPSKNDIIDVYGHLRRDKAPNDDEYAIVAASTLSDDGTSYVDFEYYRADIEVAANGQNIVLVNPADLSDLDCGHTTYKFDPTTGKVSQHGDIILSFNYTGGGKIADVRLFVWIDRRDFQGVVFNSFSGYNNLQSPTNDLPFVFGDGKGNFPFHYCDNSSANNFGYARISRNPELDRALFAQVNELSTVKAPPWGTISEKNQVVTEYAKENFAELSLNATIFGFDTRTTGGECQSPLGSVLVKTRSSDSFTASLKDFAGPFDLGNTPEFTVEVTGNTYECFEESTTLLATVDPEADPPSRTYTYQWYIFEEGYPDTSDDGVDTEDWKPIDGETASELPGATDGNTYRVYATVTIFDTPGCTFASDPVDVTQNPFEGTLTADCPSDVNKDACTVQATINSEFATWQGNFGYTDSGDGGTVTVTYFVDDFEVTKAEFDAVTAPDACDGGSVKLGISVSDECGNSDSCSATFSTTTSTQVDVEGPGDVDTAACFYADDTALQSAYTTWLGQFTTLENGCGNDGAFTTTPPTAASLTICSDVDISLTYSADDGCTSDSVTASFKATAGDQVDVDGPGDVDTAACFYADDTALQSAYTTWLGQFTTLENGCGNDGAFTTTPPTAASLTICSDVDISLTYSADDGCTSDSVTASFKATAGDQVDVDGPGDVDTAACFYADDTALQSAYTTWLGQFTTLENGCGNDGAFTTTPPTAASLTICSDVDISLTYSADDGCTSDSVTASFKATAGDQVDVDGPGDVDTAACFYADDTALQSAYTTWLGQFTTLENGCGNDGAFTTTPPTAASLTICSDVDISLTYSADDGCTSDSVTASFKATAGDQVDVDGPGDVDTAACFYADDTALQSAYTTWLGQFTTLENGCGNDGAFTTTPPTAASLTICSDVDISLTYSADDGCTSDSVTASFKATAGDQVDVEGPGDVDTAACFYADDTALQSAYTTWLGQFTTLENGCGNDGAFTTTPPTAASLTICSDVDISLTYSADDGCTSDSVTASFKATAGDQVDVDGPGDVDTAACFYADDTALQSAYTTWLGQFTTLENGCGNDGAFTTTPPTAASLTICSDVDISLTYSADDGCTSDSVTASFKATAGDQVDVEGPGDVDTAACFYADDTALQSAYITWLGQFTTLENGCGNDGAFTTTPPTAASLTICSDVDISLTYSADDGCTSDSVTASFKATAGDQVDVEGPGDVDTAACFYADDTALQSAYTTWLGQFTTLENGCGNDGAFTTTPPTAASLTICSDVDISLTYSADDGCTSDSVTASFKATAGDQVDVDGPGDVDTAACFYADDTALQSAYTTWLGQFTTLENGCGNDGAFTTTPPTAASLTICSDVDISLTYSADDGCTSDSVTASFKATAGDQVDVDGPTAFEDCAFETQAELDAAFKTWKDGFITVNPGCGATAFFVGGTPTAPDLVTGGTVNATYKIDDGCTQDQVSSSFTINPNPVADAQGGTLACDGSNLQLDGTGSTGTPELTYLWETTDGNIVSGAATATPMVSQPGTYTLTVTDGNDCVDTAVAIVSAPVNCAHLFPTQTTCCNYLSPDRENFDQDELCATVKKGEISNVIPGVFFYYGDKTFTTSGSKTVVLEQQKPSGGTYNFFQLVNLNNAWVYFDQCETVPITQVTQADGKINITFNVATNKLGNYVISVKYDSKSIIGGIPGGDNTFSFGIQGEPGSYGQLVINTSRQCSDNPGDLSDGCNLGASSTLLAADESLAKTQISQSGFSVAPVPFKEQLTLRYEFDYTSNVKIQFFDLNGSLLRTYADKQVTNGDETQINIDFALRANQVYIIRVETDRDAFSKNVMSGN